MGITTRVRVLASALVAVLAFAVCGLALADEGESATSDSELETVVVFPLRHSGEAVQSDVEFLDNIVLAGFERLPQDRFSVAAGRGGGTEFCDDECVGAQLRESGGDYAVRGEIERRDSGFFVIVWLVRVGDQIEQLGREEVGGETALSALVGPLTTAVDVLREKVAPPAEPVAAPTAAKKKEPKKKIDRARRQAAARQNAALRRQFERKRAGGGALITLGVVCALGAFGLGFAYGLTGQWPYLAAGIGTEALGVVLIVSGSIARVRAGRGMQKHGLARLEPGDLGGFDPAARRLATAPRLGLSLGFAF
jgi:hypothetical protein